MAQAGTTLPRRMAANSVSRLWYRSEGGSVDRFRAHVVAASLIFGDIAVAIVAVSLSRALMEAAVMDLPGARRLPIAALILTFLCLGLYTGCGPSPYERFRLRALGIIGFAGVELLIALPVDHPGSLVVARVSQALLLLIAGHYMEAVIRALLIRLDLWGAATILVGCGDSSRKLARLLLRQPALGLAPIGFVRTSRDAAPQKATLPLSLIGETAAPERIRAHVEFAIFASADELSALTSGSRPWKPSCRLLLVEDVHDMQSLWSRTRMLGGAIGIEIRRDLCLRHNQLLKRITDILLAIPIALLAWPIVAVLALAIKLVDRGPAFYVQRRVGRNGTTLPMLKLRTMYADAERRLQEHLSRDPQAHAEWQRFFKLSRDPRVLPIIGNFMRHTSLDELPQLWNVIRGDMSLVGPRPFPAYHVSRFDDEFRAIRMSVPPGLTGMWQISSRSNGDLQVQKAEDLFYIRNWSIWLDVYILLQTVPAVLSGKGAK